MCRGATAPGRGPAAVFLDRDGVLNDVAGDGRRARSPRSVEEVRVAVGAAEAVRRLRAAGLLVVAVTNQPDVARGSLGAPEAVAITRTLVDALALDDAYVCMHDGPDACACRKPKPGLLTTAAGDWGISLADSWLVGDRWVDVAAGRVAGVRTVLLDRPYSQDPSGGVASPSGLRAEIVVTTLAEAVAAILEARA